MAKITKLKKSIFSVIVLVLLSYLTVLSRDFIWQKTYWSSEVEHFLKSQQTIKMNIGGITESRFDRFWYLSKRTNKFGEESSSKVVLVIRLYGTKNNGTAYVSRNLETKELSLYRWTYK